jgi:hypothetical protein
MKPQLKRLALLSGVSSHDGIGLDFLRDSYYTKAPGGGVVRGAYSSIFTTTSSAKITRNSAGIWTTTGANTAAFEWDASGAPLGRRFEGARTNSCLWSSDLTNAAWTKSNLTATKDATGPDGVANSASRLTATAGNGTALQSFTSASATRQYSVFAKRRTGTGNVQLTVDNGTTWTTIAVTSTWTQLGINQAAVTNPIIGLRLVASGDEVDVMWNQLENGAAFASSPIQTTTVAVTRTVDVDYALTSGSWYNAAAQSWVVGFVPLGAPSLFTLASLSADAAYGAGFGAMLRVLSDTILNCGGNGSVASATRGVAVVPGTAYKAAGSLTTANTRMFSTWGGATGSALTLDFTGSGTTRLSLGCLGGANGQSLFGWLQSFDYYPSQLSDSALVSAAT